MGTARLLPDAHIGRVAVLAEARGFGIGAALMRAATEAARRLGHPAVELAAQTTPSTSMPGWASRPTGPSSSTPVFRTAICASPSPTSDPSPPLSNEAGLQAGPDSRLRVVELQRPLPQRAHC